MHFVECNGPHGFADHASEHGEDIEWRVMEKNLVIIVEKNGILQMHFDFLFGHLC